MADRLEPLGSSIKVERIRGYSKAEIADRIKKIEQEAQEYKNMRSKLLSQYPNPQNLTFEESLRQLTGREIKKPSQSDISDDQEGFELNIRSK